MSKQHGNMPVVERESTGGRNRRPAPLRLWYRVTYTSTHDGQHSYVVQAGRYHSEDERQRMMDKVLREQTQRYFHDRERSNKVEFFFEKPAPIKTDW